MLQQRRFTIVMPGQNADDGKTVDYTGQEVSVKL